MKNLHRFAGKISNEKYVEDHCASIMEKLRNQEFKPYRELEKHKLKQEMVMDAREGSYGEEAWTTMNLDGLECVSTGVHVVGILVGYQGYNHIGANITPSRAGQGLTELDVRLLPAIMRECDPTSSVVHPKSKTSTIDV